MNEITIYEVATSDGGGCGRYGTKRFFLNENDAEQDAKEYSGYGMVTTHIAFIDNGDILLGKDNGAYCREERVIYLAKSRSEEREIISNLLKSLSKEEKWLLANRKFLS